LKAEGSTTGLDGQRLDRELADQPRGHALGGEGKACSAAAASARSASASGSGSPAGGLKVAHEALPAGGAQLGERVALFV